MGLDMYLRARRRITDEATVEALNAVTVGVVFYDDEPGKAYLSRWSHDDEAERVMTDAVVGLAGLTPMIGEESNSAFISQDRRTVDLTAVYWRKANAVHAWFVDNCQEGVDECQETEVHPEQLAALKSACETALAAYEAGDLAGAEKTMPPQAGFFFGSTDLDEWWAKDLAYTIKEIDRVIRSAIVIGGVEFIYESSW